MNEDTTLRLDGRLDEVIVLLGKLADRMEALEKRQAELDARVDARLHETRPIWELVLARLTSIEERQQSMDRRVRWVYDEFKELKVRFRTVFNDVGKLLNDRDDFEERILKLETERSR